MTRIAAILILSILLFNWVGYQLYTTIADNSLTQSVVTRLDNDQFSDTDLVSIKIAAVHLSPYSNQRNFERINGQIEIEGRVFNYVKRRITQDSLEFLCIPNDEATLQRIAKYDFFKLVADLQADQTKKTNSNNNSHKSVNGEYFAEHAGVLFSVHGSDNLDLTDHFIADPAAGFADFDSPPPQYSC